MQNLLDDLTELLQADQAFISDGAILKNAVIEAALNMDARLLGLLMQSDTIKAHFFTEVAGALVFDKVKFQDFVSNKAFLPDSYTAFKNRIGLTDGRGDYLSQSRDVVLAWPYKDCVLEGGMTKEDRGRNEVFWNTTLTEAFAFGGGQLTLKPSSKEPVSRDFKLADFGRAILCFAMDANDFFHFANLRTYFPQLASASQFVTSDTYLGGVTVSVRGLPDDLDNLTARQKLDIAQYVLHQIESGVKRESVEYIGTKDFKPYPIKDRFTDKVLKLRIEGETGLSWTESNVPGLDQIDLSGKEWHAYDDSYGTDQEKHFIKYMHDQEARLRGIYDDFYLLRNEKAVKLYDFDTGRAFEPDFVLFLRKKGEEASTILQLFIEPKGDQLRPQDDWKQDFLAQVKTKTRIETVFQGRDYKVLGLPFFNEEGQTNADFKAAFEGEAITT